MQSVNGLKQPLLGIAATAISIALALGISVQFAPTVFGSWVGQLIMSAIPLQIIVGMVWESKFPGFLADRKQPVKGLAVLGLLAVGAAIVTPATMASIGGGMAPPTPFVIMFTILSVCITFWMVVVLQCWPAKVLSAHPAAVGLGTWVLSYGVSWVIFHTTFDFSAMQGAPFYRADLDPHGLFPAWNALAFVVTSLAVVMWLVMLDFWPSTAIVKAIPSLGNQPMFGVLSAVVALALTAVVWVLCVRVVGMDVVDYLVRVPVSALFGEFIMLAMMQTAPFQAVRQPLKGLILLPVVAVLAVITHKLYQVVALALVGPMASGAPTYGLDLWIATAMLAVTFPLFVAYATGFGFWPLAGRD